MLDNIKRRTVMKAAGAAAVVGLASNAAAGRELGGPQMNTVRHGPFRTTRYVVEVDDREIVGIHNIDLPGSKTEQGEYREGDDTGDRKLFGMTTFEDLVIERGMSFRGDEFFHNWRNDVMNHRTEDARRNITITSLDEDGEQGLTWQFQNAWVKEYQPPNLDASADGQVATETVTLAFDKMTRESP